ncbi:hypothetical protein [Gordonia phthalatica]|uniref:Pyrrolo-quinoline quinone n=1 Tax=Gordonia phthalatica TaxID=1136941 RepID=A0A0N9MMT9_9ACTN|nr:hypothetical protein [Gordonia phthalatica]ALG84026.1 hypothetical protein ACH46_05265 [Gordonia phthalatica]
MARKPLLIGLAAVSAVLVVVLVVGVVALLNRDEDSGSATPLADAQTAVEFSEAPTIQWQLPVEKATTLSNGTFGSGELYSRRPAVLQFGDRIVLTVRDLSGSAPELIALNASTGEREWSTIGDAKACADQLVDGRLACLDRTGSSTD